MKNGESATVDTSRGAYGRQGLGISQYLAVLATLVPAFGTGRQVFGHRNLISGQLQTDTLWPYVVRRKRACFPCVLLFLSPRSSPSVCLARSHRTIGHSAPQGPGTSGQHFPYGSDLIFFPGL